MRTTLSTSSTLANSLNSTDLDSELTSLITDSRTTGRLSGRRFVLLTVLNLGGAATLIYGYYTGIQGYHGLQPNMRIITICQVSAGVLLRSLVEINIAALKAGRSQPFIIENVHHFMSTFSLEIYEILWNAFINVNNLPAQIALTATRQTFIGYLLTGDFANLFKLRRADRPALTLTEVPAIQNRLLGPNFNNTKGQVTVHVLTTILGVSIVALGEVFNKDVKGLKLLSECLGSFLATQGVGYFAMDTFLRLWKKYEAYLQNTLEIESSEQGPSRSWYVKALRTFAKVSRNLAVETICSLPVFFKASWIPFPVLGTVYGIWKRSSLEEFQTLTQQDLYLLRTRHFTVSARGETIEPLAVKIQKAVTFSFFVIFTLWFSYGLFESGSKERIEIGTFIAVTILSAIIGRVLRRFFPPGHQGRLFNEAAYQLLYNAYFRVIVYQAIRQITFINDTNLDQDTSLDFGSGLVGLSLFGTQLGVNQVNNDYREIAFASPLFRSLGIAEILEGLHNTTF